jgi:hypothetical protein
MCKGGLWGCSLLSGEKGGFIEEKIFFLKTFSWPQIHNTSQVPVTGYRRGEKGEFEKKRGNMKEKV